MLRFMRLFLVLILIAACNSSSPPVERNFAKDFVTAVDETAKCSSWSQGLGSAAPDSALCKSQGTWYWCTAGATQKPKCDPVGGAQPPAGVGSSAPQPPHSTAVPQ